MKVVDGLLFYIKQIDGIEKDLYSAT